MNIQQIQQGKWKKQRSTNMDNNLKKCVPYRKLLLESSSALYMMDWREDSIKSNQDIMVYRSIRSKEKNRKSSKYNSVLWQRQFCTVSFTTGFSWYFATEKWVKMKRTPWGSWHCSDWLQNLVNGDFLWSLGNKAWMMFNDAFSHGSFSMKVQGTGCLWGWRGGVSVNYAWKN